MTHPVLPAWRVARWLAPAALGLLMAACATGSYPLDILPEMHYQESQRTQEPNRFYPPAQSVPITGKEVSYTSAELAALNNPVANSAESVARGAELFKVNCGPCHGPEAKGNGFLVGYFAAGGVRPPPDLTDPTKAPILFLPDGQVYGVITNGQGAFPGDDRMTNMPAFRKLLSPQERWAIIRYLRSIQGR